MTVPAPPAMATWLFEHVVPGNENEALAGDLLEEFHRRGSAAWYWRQVLGAMVAGFSKQLRAGWSATGRDGLDLCVRYHLDMLGSCLSGARIP